MSPKLSVQGSKMLFSSKPRHNQGRVKTFFSISPERVQSSSSPLIKRGL